MLQLAGNAPFGGFIPDAAGKFRNEYYVFQVKTAKNNQIYHICT